MVKKDSLIKGTLILAAAALVARMLGLFQRVPLDYMLSEEGMAAFSLANNVYLLLLVFATAGFPSAISKMISERHALGKVEEARRIFHAALAFGAVAGLLLASLLFALAPVLATHVAKLPGADLAIRAIAPALLLFPVIAMMRGYFQGRQMMSAGGTSQIIEQFVRVLLGLSLGFLVLGLGWGDRWGAAAVTFGSVFGSIAAFAVMLRFARKLKRQDAQSGRRTNRPMSAEASAALGPGTYRAKSAGGSRLKFRTIYKEIFAMSLPALVTSSVINVIYTFDSSLFNRLTESFYTSFEVQKVALADFGAKAQTLSGIPPILAIALGTSIIPIIASAYSLRNIGEVQKQASLVMRIVCFTGVPLALLLSVAAYSVTGLLFASPSGSMAVAALSAGTILQITMMTSNSILYGMGKQRVSMSHTLLGLLLKVAVSVALAPVMGVYGLIIGSTVCFLLVTLLNLRLINKEARLVVLGKRWLPYAAAVAIAALAGWGAEFGVLRLTEGWPDKLSYLFAAAAAAVVVGGLYAALLFLFRVITPEDVQSFPAALRKPINKLMRVFRLNAATR